MWRWLWNLLKGSMKQDDDRPQGDKQEEQPKTPDDLPDWVKELLWDENVAERLPDIELHPAKLIDCQCGDEFLIRTIDGILPFAVECNKCKARYLGQTIRKAQTVWWYDCNGCGREIICDFPYDDENDAFLMPHLLVCPECETVFVMP